MRPKQFVGVMLVKYELVIGCNSSVMNSTKTSLADDTSLHRLHTAGKPTSHFNQQLYNTHVVVQGHKVFGISQNKAVRNPNSSIIIIIIIIITITIVIIGLTSMFPC